MTCCLRRWTSKAIFREGRRRLYTCCCPCPSYPVVIRCLVLLGRVKRRALHTKRKRNNPQYASPSTSASGPRPFSLHLHLLPLRSGRGELSGSRSRRGSLNQRQQILSHHWRHGPSGGELCIDLLHPLLNLRPLRSLSIQSRLLPPSPLVLSPGVTVRRGECGASTTRQRWRGELREAFSCGVPHMVRAVRCGPGSARMPVCSPGSVSAGRRSARAPPSPRRWCRCSVTAVQRSAASSPTDQRCGEDAAAWAILSVSSS